MFYLPSFLSFYWSAIDYLTLSKAGLIPDTWKRRGASQVPQKIGVLGHYLPFLSIIYMKITNFPIKSRGANPQHSLDLPLVRVYIVTYLHLGTYMYIVTDLHYSTYIYIYMFQGLMNVTDKYIYDQLVKGKEGDSFYKG